MVQTASTSADTADPISDAVVSPEASLVARNLLKMVLANSAGAPSTLVALVQALLANVLMNDYLNWWNAAFPVKIVDAQDAIDQAIKLDPPDSVRALVWHAQGLVDRANGQPNLARKAFRKAKQLKSGFARAHAQFGNQKAALERLDEVQKPLDHAMRLNPRHPASGYFYWGKGRGYFEEAVRSKDAADWSNALKCLEDSVKALPTVWYNRCYLAAAQNCNGDQAGAQQTINDFVNKFDKDTFTRIRQLQPDLKDPARKIMLEFVRPRLPQA